ncbi:ABC transporter substrate-binding protein [Bacillus sp. IITD106]|nr:ABC transporter substrate-binding protein [Bacillus sp. IITD106]
MFKKSKLSNLLLATILIVSVILAGCAGGGKSKKSSTKDGDGAYKITMAYLDTGTQDDLKLIEEEISKITKEKINATVELLPTGFGVWNEQTNLMLTSGEKLDLIVTGSVFNYNTQAVKGQLVPLDDLLQSYGQGILEVFPDHILDATRVNGEIYGIPSMREWSADYGFVMRKDLVDKHNIDLSNVKTFEDLDEVFRVIKENEPDIVPSGSALTPVTAFTYGKFDNFGSSVGALDLTKEGDWTVINQFEHPLYESAVKKAREWYQAGYTPKDAATAQELGAPQVKNGKAFGYLNNTKPGFERQESIITGYEMDAVRLTDNFQATGSITSFMLSIAKNSQNPEKAMEFLNLLYTDADIMNLLTLGIEGKHYQETPDGFVNLIPDSGYSLDQWQLANNFITKIKEGQPADYWEQMSAFNDTARQSPAFGFTFNADPVKTEIATVSNVIEQYQKALEMGTLDPDKSLPEFHGKLKAAGADKIIAEKQKQLDEWKANKK